MTNKKSIDLSLEGAVNAVHEMFFEVEQVIEKVIKQNGNAYSGVGEPDDKPEPKRKPVGNTFNPAKEKGEKDESGKGAPKKPAAGDKPDDSGGDESDDE